MPAEPPKRPSIEQFLIREGLVGEELLRAALLTQKSTGEPLGQILIRTGQLDPVALALALARQFEEPAAERNVRIFAFVAGKGGSGTTFLAVNAAVGLARSGMRVCLVDLNLQMPNVHYYLNLAKTRSCIAELAQSANLDDPAAVAAHATPCGERLHILNGPRRIEDAETVTVAKFRAIVKALRRSFDLLIFDLPPHVGDLSLEAFDAADRIVLVVTSSFASVCNSIRIANLLRSLNMPDGKVMPVLNAYDPAHLDRATVEKYLTIKIAHAISADPLVEASLNHARPLIERLDGGTLYNELAAFVNGLADRPAMLTREVSGFWDKFRSLGGARTAPVTAAENGSARLNSWGFDPVARAEG